MPYSPQYKKITNIIKKYLPILTADQKMTDVLKTPVHYVARKVCTVGNLVSPKHLS